MMRGRYAISFQCDRCKPTETMMDSSESLELEIPLPLEVDSDESELLTDEIPRDRTELNSFTVDLPFTRCLDPQESPVQPPAPVQTVIPDIPVTYTVVEGGNLRGGDLLVSTSGYGFTKKRTRGTTVYWWCSHRNRNHRCPATVISKEGHYKKGTHSHDHLPEPGLLKKKQIDTKVKAISKENLFRSAMDIAEEVVDTHIEESDFDLPSRPELIIDALPSDYLRHDIKTEGARHIIFSTDRQLECLNGTKQWYVDGTFKVLRKRDPFQQLFTIHAFLTNEIGESKQVPLLFVFMSKRRKRDYKKVFKLCDPDP